MRTLLLKLRSIKNFHPVLFGIFFVTSIFVSNIDLVLFYGHTEFVILILVVSVSSFLLWKGINLIVKNQQKAGFLASFSIIMFFSYGHITNMLDNLNFDELYFMILWFGIIAVGILGILKLKRELNNLTTILFVVSLSMIFLPMVDVIGYQQSLSKSEFLSISEEPQIINATVGGDYPDIYYLIFDRYPASEILNNLYQYDNSEFLKYLENNGFYVASESRANYPFTFHSLASSRNMEYINYLSDIAGDFNNRIITYQLDNLCKACKFLESKGYEYIHVGGLWIANKAEINTEAKGKFRLPVFTAVVYETTVLAHARNMYVGVTPRDEQDREDSRQLKYETEIKQFSFLENIPQDDKPLFVYAHFLLPHRPYVYDENGEYVSLVESKKIYHKEGFRNQLTFLNNNIMNLVDKLLESDTKPIIIIQADEGPYPYRDLATRSEGDFDFSKMTIEELDTKNRILNAFYLPDGNNEVLHQSISPVNTFRIIFNQYFDEDLELLPDLYYVYKDVSHYYEFVNVTDRVLDQSYKNIDFDKDFSYKFDWEKINVNNNSNEFTYISQLLNIYYQREDLREAFPEVEEGNFKHLLGWAGEYGLAVYPQLSNYEYIYKLMTVYDQSKELPMEFPEAINGVQLNNLFCWAKNVGVNEVYDLKSYSSLYDAKCTELF